MIQSKTDHEKIIAIQEVIADIVQFESSYNPKVGPPMNRCIIIPYIWLASQNGPTKSDLFMMAVQVYELFLEQVVNSDGNGQANLMTLFPARTDNEADQITLHELFEEGYELFKAQICARSTFGKTVVADVEKRKIGISTLYQEVIAGLFATPGLLSAYSDLNTSSFYGS